MDECFACGKLIIQIAGHSCGDSPGTQLVRENLGQALLAKQKLEEELAELRRFLVPIAKHHAGNYNKWTVSGEGRGQPNYIEALDYVVKYLRDDTKRQLTSQKPEIDSALDCIDKYTRKLATN